MERKLRFLKSFGYTATKLKNYMIFDKVSATSTIYYKKEIINGKGVASIGIYLWNIKCNRKYFYVEK